MGATVHGYPDRLWDRQSVLSAPSVASYSRQRSLERAAAAVQDFFKFLWDDAAMLSSSRAHWTLVPAAEANTSAQQNSDSIDATQNGKRHTYGLRIAYPEQAREICSKGLVVGSCAQADIRLESNQVRCLLLCVPAITGMAGEHGLCSLCHCQRDSSSLAQGDRACIRTVPSAVEDAW